MRLPRSEIDGTFGGWAWENTRGRFEAWWDGHPWHVRLWDVSHPPKWIIWTPRPAIKLRRWNPVFWLVLIFGGL